MTSLPYVTSPGNIEKAFIGIRNEAVPDRVSQDFVKTILKIPGGSGDQMTAFLKKLGLANGDGAPNELYQKFRNPSSSGAAIAKAIRKAYAPLYVRNEFMHKLSSEQLIGLIIEETGLPHDSNPVKLTARCIEALKQFANFDSNTEDYKDTVKSEPKNPQAPTYNPKPATQPPSNIGLNLGYTINLNLPATSDPAVFDAIFKSLKENLLREDDG